MPETAPWWVGPISSLAISVAVFALGYFLVYRRQLGPQLRHLHAQLQDREARLSAAQAVTALQIARSVNEWCSSKSPTTPSSWHLPKSGDALDPARLANDKELVTLLGQVGELIHVVNATQPDSWTNMALVINRDEDLKGRLGPLDMDETKWTEAQREFLKPLRAQWEVDHAKWSENRQLLCGRAAQLRDRAEYLLKRDPDSLKGIDTLPTQGDNRERG